MCSCRSGPSSGSTFSEEYPTEIAAPRASRTAHGGNRDRRRATRRPRRGGRGHAAATTARPFARIPVIPPSEVPARRLRRRGAPPARFRPASVFTPGDQPTKRHVPCPAGAPFCLTRQSGRPRQIISSPIALESLNLARAGDLLQTVCLIWYLALQGKWLLTGKI